MRLLSTECLNSYSEQCRSEAITAHSFSSRTTQYFPVLRLLLRLSREISRRKSLRITNIRLSILSLPSKLIQRDIGQLIAYTRDLRSLFRPLLLARSLSHTYSTQWRSVWSINFEKCVLNVRSMFKSIAWWCGWRHSIFKGVVSHSTHCEWLNAIVCDDDDGLPNRAYAIYTDVADVDYSITTQFFFIRLHLYGIKRKHTRNACESYVFLRMFECRQCVCKSEKRMKRRKTNVYIGAESASTNAMATTTMTVKQPSSMCTAKNHMSGAHGLPFACELSNFLVFPCLRRSRSRPMPRTTTLSTQNSLYKSTRCVCYVHK